MELPLARFALATDGTPLAKFADGASATPGITADGAIRWNNHSTPAAIIQTVPFPRGITTITATLRIWAAKSGTANAVTFDATFMPFTEGVAHDAGTPTNVTTAAMTAGAAAKTVQLVEAAVSLTVPAGTPALCVSVKPTAGTLGSDDVTLFRAELKEHTYG